MNSERERAARICEQLMPDAERDSGPEAAGWLERAASYIRNGNPTAFVPHRACTTYDACRREGTCLDGWNCASGEPHDS